MKRFLLGLTFLLFSFAPLVNEDSILLICKDRVGYSVFIDQVEEVDDLVLCAMLDGKMYEYDVHELGRAISIPITAKRGWIGLKDKEEWICSVNIHEIQWSTKEYQDIRSEEMIQLDGQNNVLYTSNTTVKENTQNTTSTTVISDDNQKETVVVTEKEIVYVRDTVMVNAEGEIITMDQLAEKDKEILQLKEEAQYWKGKTEDANDKYALLRKKGSNYLAVGVNVGGAVYSGHYAETFGFKNIRPAASIFVQKRFSDRMHLRASFAYSQLEADRLEGEGLAFSADVKEFNLLVVHDFLKKQKKTNDSFFANYQFYGMFGLGMAQIDSDIMIDNKTYGGLEGEILAGLGTRYIINPNWTLGFELLGVAPTSNRIDGNTDQTIPTDLFGTATFSLTYRILGDNRLIFK